MVMLGADDRRVPPAQGLEIYRALQARNIPSRYEAATIFSQSFIGK